MTDTFVCGECQEEQKETVLHTIKFAFPKEGDNGISVITVDVKLCTSCFMAGGLSEKQKSRIKTRIMDKIREKGEQDENGTIDEG